MRLQVANLNVDYSQKRLVINDKLAAVILFSGGVESTALVQYALDSGFFPYCVSYKLSQNQVSHQNKMIEICNRYNVPLQIMDLRMCAPNQFGYTRKTHPWWAIAGSIAAISMPNLAYVWVGANSGLREVNDDGGDALPMYGEAISTINQSSKMVKGNVITTMPLSRLTKLEQWEMIPDKIKPLVVTCEMMSKAEEMNQESCGTCKKCVELKAMFDDNAYRQFCGVS